VEDIFWSHPGGDQWHMQEGEEDVDCFKRVDAGDIPLRGKKYLTDKKKFPSKSAAYELVCCKCFKTKDQMLHSAQAVESLRKFLADNSDNDYFIINWLVPGHYTVVNLYVRKLPYGEDKEFDTLLQKFREGDDKFRSTRFKYIPIIHEAPSVVKASVVALLGRLRPVLIGNKLTTHHFIGKNYTEVNVDTGSSSIVNAAAGILIKGFKGIIATTAFLIEGRDEDELPERMLGVRRSHAVFRILRDLSVVCFSYTATGGLKSRRFASSKILSFHSRCPLNCRAIFRYDYTAPPPLKKKKSSWFGGMFGSSKRGSKSKVEETKEERRLKQASSIEENVEPNTQGV